MPPLTLRPALLAVVATVWGASPAGAQLLERAKQTAKGTVVGRAVSGASTEVQLLDARHVDLDPYGLPTVQVGMLAFGVSAVEIKNGEGVRVHAFLFNPLAETVSVPEPPPDLFVLVDDRGRRLERVGGIGRPGDNASAGPLEVPPLERLALTLVFNELKDDARTATLKVGTAGMITGIPVNTAAVGSLSAQPGAPNPWAPQPETPPPPYIPPPPPQP